MNGNVASLGYSLNRSGCFDDIGMSAHAGTMQYALDTIKCQMHSQSIYADFMESPNERLRIARIKAGFETAADAARALGIKFPTYAGHENGHRGFPAKRAPLYARRFKVSEEWLLYGKGEGPSGERAPTADIIDIWEHIPVDNRAQALAILETFSAKKRG